MKRKSIYFFIGLVIVLIIIFLLLKCRQNNVFSYFEKNDEGWKVVGDAKNAFAKPDYHATGGNPGGFLSATDETTGGVWYWKVPKKFLGSKGGAAGKKLSYDLKQSDLINQFDAPDVILESNDFILVYTFPSHPKTTWTSKYGFTKELIKTGANTPELLYGHFDRLTPLLKNQNNIIKWTGIDLIGYLSSIDNDNKTDKYIPTLIKFLHSGHLITCNHSIFTLGLVAQNKSRHRRKIIKELLFVTKDTFDTDECKNIAIGKVLDTLKHLITDIKDDKTVIDFIKMATTNKRNSTKKKAIQLLSKIQKQ